MDQILNQLEFLRNQYPEAEDQETFSAIEKAARTAYLTSNLQNNDAMKLMIDQYTKQLTVLRDILQNDASLFADEKGRLLGQVIHARIEWCKNFLKIFSNAETAVDNYAKRLEKYVNETTP